MRRSRSHGPVAAAISAGLIGCAQAPAAVSCELEPLPLTLPTHFPGIAAPRAHPQSDLGRGLGRKLFFDPALSENGRVACSTCHDPEHAFSVPDALSTRGVSGNPLPRHAPSLLNVAFFDRGLFWDGGAKNLESQALAPLTGPDEMGQTDLQALLDTLRRDPQYVACFDRVFGPDAINLGNVLAALAQFERSLVDADTRWDRALQGKLALSEVERAGSEVFGQRCASCHPPPLFTDRDFHNNGLDPELRADKDSEHAGRMRVTGRAEDLGAYKTPSLRRLGASAPYMHDGRFSSLREVVDHYRYQLRPSRALDPILARSLGHATSDTWSDAEATALTAFLETLN